MSEEFATELISATLIGLLLIVPLWKIHKKAGLSPPMSLLIFVPFFGGLIVYLVLAFSKWPNTEGV